MSEEEIIEYFKEVISWHRKNTPDRVYALNNKDIEMIQEILDLYNKEKLNSLNLSEQLNKEKEKNKELFEEYNKRVATIIKYEQEIKEIIDKIDVEDYYCLNEAEEDLRKLVE